MEGGQRNHSIGNITINSWQDTESIVSFQDFKKH